ncbi:hypothetical protein ACFZCK_37010 [Kitasatospora purpeofusca]|uniref:hypothetical protein n=1 Tax=Kitasatospora purpeofusca TaxID=67352 RepID=UPI0036F02DF5
MAPKFPFSGGEADPGSSGLGLGPAEGQAVVVDGGERPADEELAVPEVDVRPVQGEDLAAAQASTKDDLEQVGELVGVLLGDLAITFVNLDELTEDQRQAMTEAGRRGIVVTRDQHVEVSDPEGLVIQLPGQPTGEDRAADLSA